MKVRMIREAQDAPFLCRRRRFRHTTVVRCWERTGFKTVGAPLNWVRVFFSSIYRLRLSAGQKAR